MIAAILLVIALIFRMLWPFFSDMFQTGEVYVVPDLLGMTRAEAQEKIMNDSELAGHFTITVSEETGYNEKYEAGEIILQDPTGGTTTKEETTEITVVLNADSTEEGSLLYMPDILGQNYESWASVLSTDYHVTVKYSPEYSDDVPEGNIISTDPVAGTELHEGDKVTLTYSKGKKITTTTMVSLYGMTESKARSTLTELGLETGNVVTVESSESAGTVVMQSVKAGATVELGTAVDLQISSGPPDTADEPVTEPDDEKDNETGDDPSQQEPEEEEVHTIVVNMPENRKEESIIVISINGKSYFTRTVAADENQVRVNYKGNIESITVVVDGVDYNDYEIK